ncbi:MAG TPA: hypothetical protein VGR62_00085 [Candidatus Binatia bacterium]|jgi:hypothetical protein|nr:hypothetical protein [Candidatus Binatia bacterium]
MRHRLFAVRRVVLTTLLALGVPCNAGAQDVESLRREMDAMKRQIGQMQEMLKKQDEVIRRLEAKQTTAPAPKATAESAPASDLDKAVAAAQAESPATPGGPVVPQPSLASRSIGGSGATLRLIDVSVDTLLAAGTSTATDPQIELLEGGGHDPKRRGFTLQQSELSFAGAVDPYFTGEMHVVFTDAETELEEAFLTTQALPYGLQVQAGQFLTDFGRINPTHPHAWDWMDQPVINTRMFGPDGLRNPGFRLGWLAPLPWFSQVHLGAQNAGGDSAVSFLGDNVGDEHSHGDDGDAPVVIGRRPTVSRDVQNLGDLLYLTRWENGVSFTDTLSAKIGGSALFGPNSSGAHGRTTIYGTDLVAKWRPVDNFRGWPFVIWQSEVMARNYRAGAVDDAQFGNLPSTTLHDWGLYTQLLYGFHYGWSAGLRYEYDSGSGQSVGGREDDPLRDDRQRISPLLTWRPTEFSRLRLQYNLDRAAFLHDEWQSSVWLGIEVLYGQHPAHNY